MSKIDNYVQFVTGGKAAQEVGSMRNSLGGNRVRAATPTPRRMSVCLMEQGRRSVAKENASRDYCRVSGSKTPKERSKPLFVKGSNIVKATKSRE